jgi:hypothetical protein
MSDLGPRPEVDLRAVDWVDWAQEYDPEVELAVPHHPGSKNWCNRPPPTLVRIFSVAAGWPPDVRRRSGRA